MADRPNRVGQQLGNYHLIRFLGRGSFADVYLGEHLHLGTRAAIKVLHTHLTSSNVETFRTEARMIAHFVHPHIVRVLDFGVEGTTPYLVMDYATGGSLRERHPEGTILPVALIVSYIQQIADALHYAHAEKLVHRDVKPENMLLDRYHNVLLSDFGIAVVTQSSFYERTQDLVGTVAYMSPEQIQGKPRPASDQYALGVVVYEWLCGDRPFHGSFTELCTQHIFALPPPLHERVSSISPGLEQVVMTALAKDPRQRFASVQIFATALRQKAQALPPPVAPPERVQGEVARRAELRQPPAVPRPNERRPETEGPLSPSFITEPVSDHRPGAQSELPSAHPLPDTSPPSHVEPSETARPTILKVSPVLIAGRNLSRRQVLVGLAALAIASGGVIWWRVSQNSSVGTLLYTYTGHSSFVKAVAWSPDGQRIVSGSDDKTVQVWDAADGGHPFTYTGHSDRVFAVAWSPDGQRIVSGGGDHMVRVWNAADGSHPFTYQGHSSFVNAVVWSPDGRRIASGSDDKTVQVWNAADGKNAFTYTGHADAVRVVMWSPDGRRIASGSDDTTVQVWDAADGKNVFSYAGHSSQVNAVAWSPDGKRIASGSGDHTVQVWDAADGKNAFTYTGHSSWVYAVEWSPDSQRIASGSLDTKVQVWNAADGKNAFIYTGHSDSVNAVAWSPDGQRIASGSDDKTVQVWVAS